MKRSWLRSKGKSELSQCKDRIQKLLTQIVRIRDNGCVLQNYPETGGCEGPTAADHIISRVRNVTYGDTRNVMCLCRRHHIFWKPINPLLYSSIIRRYLGHKKFEWIERAQLDNKSYPMGLHDWKLIEIGLKEELKKLSPESLLEIVL